MRTKPDAHVLAVIWLLSFTAMIGFALFKAKLERDTFNKFKRPDQPAATMWDAMFSDLRITN